MALQDPYLHTNDLALPIYNPSAAELAIHADPNRLVWLEGTDGLLRKPGWWVDRSGPLLATSGGLVGGNNAVGNIAAAAFDGAQSVDLGTIFPVNSDYQIWCLFQRTSGPAGSVAALIGSKAASYHTIHYDDAGADLYITHQGTVQCHISPNPFGKDEYALLGWEWTESTKAWKLYKNGTVIASGTGSYSNTDPSCVIGALPALAGNRNLYANVYAFLLTKDVKSPATRALYDAYFKGMVGL